MKYIISGTNRPNSRTLQVAKLVQRLYDEAGEKVEIIDLAKVGVECLGADCEYGDKMPPQMRDAVTKITQSDGLIVIVPEYNGSMPGALKYFIDHWIYPDSFEFRPIALVGLGGRFGALRPVEHLQGVFGYRNGFIYPERVFITDVGRSLTPEGDIGDPRLGSLLKSQVMGFQAFTKALAVAGIDANARLRARAAATSPAPVKS